MFNYTDFSNLSRYIFHNKYYNELLVCYLNFTATNALIVKPLNL